MYEYAILFSDCKFTYIDANGKIFFNEMAFCLSEICRKERNMQQK